MIYNRKTFTSNPGKLSFKSEKVYLLHSGQLNRETHNSKMWKEGRGWAIK
jgi:hypothetical protein